MGDDLFELRHVGKLNTRIIYFFIKGQPDYSGSWNPEQRHENKRHKFRDIPAKENGLAGTEPMMKQKTNFDKYLEDQLQRQVILPHALKKPAKHGRIAHADWQRCVKNQTFHRGACANGWALHSNR